MVKKTEDIEIYQRVIAVATRNLRQIGCAFKIVDADGNSLALSLFDSLSTVAATRAELLAAVEWAIRAQETFPSVPATPDLEFTLPLPDWDTL